jgi:hypothetical protein
LVDGAGEAGLVVVRADTEDVVTDFGRCAAARPGNATATGRSGTAKLVRSTLALGSGDGAPLCRTAVDRDIFPITHAAPNSSSSPASAPVMRPTLIPDI